MDDLLERVRATGLVGAAALPLVVLLSGGRDSTCLLDICVELAGAGAIRALHVDYGLRGAASDGDREHCVALCERLGVALEVRRAGAPSGNTQGWARKLRYAAGAEAVAALGPGARLVAGHTISDQVETILYRLAVSPGRRALRGMEAETERLIRPLLAAEATRADTAAWCEARGLAWREDASNLDRAYARARVREDLLPALRAVDARAEVNILRTARLLRDEGAVLDELVAGVLRGPRSPAARRARRAAAGARPARAAAPGRGRGRRPLRARGDPPGTTCSRWATTALWTSATAPGRSWPAAPSG